MKSDASFPVASCFQQDTDRSGTIAFNEFVGLFKYIGEWQTCVGIVFSCLSCSAFHDAALTPPHTAYLFSVFRHFDTDRSGTIDGQELSNALRQFGYNLNPHLLSLVEQKYGESRTLPNIPYRLADQIGCHACVYSCSSRNERPPRDHI